MKNMRMSRDTLEIEGGFGRPVGTDVGMLSGGQVPLLSERVQYHALGAGSSNSTV